MALWASLKAQRPQTVTDHYGDVQVLVAFLQNVFSGIGIAKLVQFEVGGIGLKIEFWLNESLTQLSTNQKAKVHTIIPILERKFELGYPSLIRDCR